MPVRLTKSQAAALGVKRPHKYRAKPTVYDGVTYHSKSEAAYARHLDELKAAGMVHWWLRQTPIRLSPPGDAVVETTRVDFVVCYRTIGIMAVEVKGVETAAWKHVKKAWAAYGPFPLRVIRNGKEVERIERPSEARGESFVESEPNPHWRNCR